MEREMKPKKKKNRKYMNKQQMFDEIRSQSAYNSCKFDNLPILLGIAVSKLSSRSLYIYPYENKSMHH